MKKTPEFISFAGIDDRTDLTMADELARQYPIEWGILKCDRSNESRFPSKQAIDEILDINGKKSCHLCGKYSKRFQRMEEHENYGLEKYERIQVNGFKVGTENFVVQKEKYNAEIIIQWRSDSFELVDFKQYLPLYDMSGGNGIFPDKFPHVPNDLGGMVGLAGGLSPETIDKFISMIEPEGDYWIDMESQVRSNGWMDLEKIKFICEKIYG